MYAGSLDAESEKKAMMQITQHQRKRCVLKAPGVTSAGVPARRRAHATSAGSQGINAIAAIGT